MTVSQRSAILQEDISVFNDICGLEVMDRDVMDLYVTADLMTFIYTCVLQQLRWSLWNVSELMLFLNNWHREACISVSRALLEIQSQVHFVKITELSNVHRCITLIGLTLIWQVFSFCLWYEKHRSRLLYIDTRPGLLLSTGVASQSFQKVVYFLITLNAYSVHGLLIV